MTSSKLTSRNGYISRRKLNLTFVTALQIDITNLKKISRIIVPRLLLLISNHICIAM